MSIDWSSIETSDQTTAATATTVSSLLALVDVAAIDASTVPLLAAAAAELALVSGMPWRFSTDDPAVALLRVIARATLTAPDAGGPHTDRLAAHLSRHVGGGPVTMQR
ncbi:MAG: hypothetical protein AB8G26_15375 [Ilumatobacter sp.]